MAYKEHYCKLESCGRLLVPFAGESEGAFNKRKTCHKSQGTDCTTKMYKQNGLNNGRFQTQPDLKNFCCVCGTLITRGSDGPYDYMRKKACRKKDNPECYKYLSRINGAMAKVKEPSACQAKKAPIRKHRYVDNPAISEHAPIVPVEKMPVTRYVPHCLAKMPVDISTTDVIVKFITCGESRAICPTYTPPKPEDIIPFPKAKGEWADDYVKVQKS